MRKPVRKQLQKRPITRRVQDYLADTSSSVRNAPGENLRKRVPRVAERNIGEGVAVGAIEAGVAIIIEETLGVPLGASSDTIDVDVLEEGNEVYTVNVNAPTRNMAEARAFLDAGTGFTSYLTEVFEVEEVEIVRTRMVRDTYQVVLRIRG